MGYIRHQAIVVTGWDNSDIGGKHTTVTAREHAIQLGLPCTNIVRSMTNGYTSFMIAPDGSKEGWETSNEQETFRSQWMHWAKTQHGQVDWACVGYGGDDPELARLCDFNGKGDND
jgi:hypothetical protein